MMDIYSVLIMLISVRTVVGRCCSGCFSRVNMLKTDVDIFLKQLINKVIKRKLKVINTVIKRE